MVTRAKSGLQVTAGQNVRRNRLAAGMSQEQLAEVCGYHRTYVGSIERGERNITLATLAALAGALGVDAKELLVK